MTLKSQIASDISTFMNTDEFAESVTYNSTAIQAVAILDDFKNSESPDAFKGLLYVASSSLASVPAYRDTVVIGSSTWTVFRDVNDNAYYESAGIYIINIFRKERPGLF